MSGKFKLVLLSSAQVKENLNGIRATLVKLDQDIHAAAVQCLAHCAVHGDTSLMTLLITDIVGKDSGYRREGMIKWMRRHSPMELNGTTINLSGLITTEAQRTAMIAAFPDTDPKLFVVGERRPFLVDEANAAPFRSQEYAKEQVKPLFQNKIADPINAAIKRFTAAVENTANGQPIDASKPYYDGVDMDKVASVLDTIKTQMANLPVDLTAVRRERQARLAQDLAAEEADKALEGGDGEGKPHKPAAAVG